MSQKATYLKIQSQIHVNVTSGLKHLNLTDATANVGDKLKVQALWAKELVRIIPGTSWYPAEVKEWNTVKALTKDGILTLGEEVDEIPKDRLKEGEYEFIMSNFEKLKMGKEEVKRQVQDLKAVEKSQKDSIKLSEINI